MASELQTDYGDFAADFAAECLSNLCEPDGGVQTGPFGSQLHQEDYVAVGTPIITVEHLGENRIEHSDVPCVSNEDRTRLSKYQLRKGDIVFSRVGSVDRRALVRESEDGWLFSGRCLRVRPDKSKIDPEYLSYFFGLPSFKEYIRAIAVGATMPSLNTQILSDVVVAHPKDVNEQRAIARVLSTLDDKIELNRRMNETLEAMVRALFKSWFVDFDPVRAKAKGRDPGLPKHIADLFSNRFEDSELGEIPAGWHVSRILQLTSNIQYGLTQSASAKPVGPKFLRITDIQGGRVNWDTVPYCNLAREENERYRLKPGDILVARTGASTGENIYLPIVPDAVFASYLVRLQFHDLAIARFVGAFMRTAPYFDFVAGSIGGSAQPNASAQVLAGAELVISSAEVVHRYAEIVRPLDRRVAANNEESRILTGLRDTLLPKLISGDVRVAGHEQFLEAIP